jgi:hypothetical protein
MARQYGIDRVDFSWNGLDFKEGMAAGSTITETQAAPRTTKKPTGQGKIVRVFDPNRSGTLAVLVDQESKLHQQLLAIAEEDRVNRNQVANGVMSDTSSGYVVNYKNMYIQTEPDEVRATTSSVFTWLFDYEVKEAQPIAEPTNAVGS